MKVFDPERRAENLHCDNKCMKKSLKSLFLKEALEKICTFLPLLGITLLNDLRDLEEFSST